MNILFCKKCEEFTLKSNCPKCNAKTVSASPAKFSPEDKYGAYRRLGKVELESKE